MEIFVSIENGFKKMYLCNYVDSYELFGSTCAVRLVLYVT